MMKYATEIVVEVSLQEFLKKFLNPENLKHWHRGLVSAEHLGGTPQTPGARMKLTYHLGSKPLELIETVNDIEKSKSFEATYHSKEMDNIQKNLFYETDDGHTKWICKNKFVPLSFSSQMYTLTMPRIFKQQTRQYMKDFKNYVENGVSVYNAQ